MTRQDTKVSSRASRGARQLHRDDDDDSPSLTTKLLLPARRSVVEASSISTKFPSSLWSVVETSLLLRRRAAAASSSRGVSEGALQREGQADVRMRLVVVAVVHDLADESHCVLKVRRER